MSKDKLRNELLGKKEPAQDDLENSLPNQTPCSGNRAKGVVWLDNPLPVTHRYNQPSSYSIARNRDRVIQERSGRSYQMV